MADIQEIFPRGYIAMGGSDLVTATNIKVDIKNNAKQVHSLRKKGLGITQGNEETSVTFDCVVGEFGEEADWFKAVKKGTIKQIRVKVPGRTITVNGMFTDISVDIPLDAEIKESLTFIGHMDD